MEPILFDSSSENNVMSPQGQAMTPGFTNGLNGMENSDISFGIVWMPPAGSANAHKHIDTDIIVSVVEAGPEGAVTLWGEELENIVIQKTGQLLYMPKGVPHVAINPSSTHHIRAFEFRSSGNLMLDNVLLPDLQYIVDLVRADILGVDTPSDA